MQDQQATSAGAAPGQEKGTWRERIAALRNLPPLLKIIWDSGPGIVSGSLVCRLLAALTPLAMLAISKRILDAIQSHLQGKALVEHFWYLVAAEFALAMTGALMARGTSYFDGVLAERFTHHVSIRVMEHASRLDLASYEDPHFHDTAGAGAGAGHGPHRHDPGDRHGDAADGGGVELFARDSVVLAVAACWCWWRRWCRRFSARAISRFWDTRSAYPPDAGAAAARLPAHAGREQGVGEGTEAVRAERLSYGRIRAPVETSIFDENVRLARRRLWAGAALSLLGTAAYYGAYAYVIYRTVPGALTWGTLQFLAGRHRRRQQQHPERLFDVCEHRRPVAVPHGFGRISCG